MDSSNLTYINSPGDLETSLQAQFGDVSQRPEHGNARPQLPSGSNVTPLLRSGLDLTRSDLKAQIALADGLAEQVAILDSNWTLLAFNQAWEKAAIEGTCPDLSVGSSYLDYCDELARHGDAEAQLSAAAMRSIDSGDIARFDQLVGGDGSTPGRKYQVRIYSSPSRHRWRTVVRYDVTELVVLKQQKRGFGDQILKAEAEERRRVARDLHDTTAQDLVALQLTLANLKRGRGPAFREKLIDADEALGRLQREIRSLSYLFHSPTPDQPSLSKGLEELARGFGQRTGLNIALFLDDADLLDGKLCMMVHRLIQEALANIHRHAKASEVEIRLVITDRRLHVMIKDDGIGFRIGAHVGEAAGVGLRSMAERVEEQGGRLVLTSGRDGTSIIASLPFRDEGSLASFA